MFFLDFLSFLFCRIFITDIVNDTLKGGLLKFKQIVTFIWLAYLTYWYVTFIYSSFLDI